MVLRRRPDGRKVDSSRNFRCRKGSLSPPRFPRLATRCSATMQNSVPRSRRCSSSSRRRSSCRCTRRSSSRTPPWARPLGTSRSVCRRSRTTIPRRRSRPRSMRWLRRLRCSLTRSCSGHSRTRPPGNSDSTAANNRRWCGISTCRPWSRLRTRSPQDTSGVRATLSRGRSACASSPGAARARASRASPVPRLRVSSAALTANVSSLHARRRTAPASPANVRRETAAADAPVACIWKIYAVRRRLGPCAAAGMHADLIRRARRGAASK
jgi:hypothetical protein